MRSHSTPSTPPSGLDFYPCSHSELLPTASPTARWGALSLIQVEISVSVALTAPLEQCRITRGPSGSTCSGILLEIKSLFLFGLSRSLWILCFFKNSLRCVITVTRERFCCPVGFFTFPKLLQRSFPSMLIIGLQVRVCAWLTNAPVIYLDQG